ncbi:hypothetical protein Mlab_0784 [Methanocorpusculum labreanum Z]|uniref:DUF3821 domain-containing protein n=1 Tax=Methanocorpusculum labreanum (strain ATCC 43576 / DSM 4855 / Z) TaxID=410358 RepID=A2SRJ9_METLZ|nr:hypothetical protein [Methanocorpusculum labreanum]ABN06955.1 hypothetical protein Mlab_0784 [Methanocorpusculum labreanum Z]
MILTAALFILPAAGTVSLNILQPSIDETYFAEMRDLYVYGSFANTGDPADVRVRVYNPEGEVIRTLQSHVDMTGETPSSSVDMSLVPENLQWGDILAVEGITDPYGSANGGNKVLVSKKWGYYLAFVQGGVTKNYSGMYGEADEDGNVFPYTEDFTSGIYRIVVDVLDKNGHNIRFIDGNGESVDSIELPVSFGLTHASLGMFRPDENRENVISYARQNDLRSYIDWFPGYFQISGGLAGYQIPAVWQPNNGIEVVNSLEGTIYDTPEYAENTLLMYNLGSSSTTVQLELAQILRAGLEDSEKTTYTYYDTGEISYTWIDADDGMSKTLSGEITTYPDMAEPDFRVIYTHADSSEDPIPQNTISLLPNLTKSVDTSPYEVTVTRGEYLALYGLTRPIATTLSDAGTPYRYNVDDQIMGFTYTCGDAEYTFEGLLNRVFVNPDGSLYAAVNTNYEFGHVFTAEDTANMPIGTNVYEVKGYDANGTYVENTSLNITITVVPETFTPTGFILPLSILLAGITMGAAVITIRKL